MLRFMKVFVLILCMMFSLGVCSQDVKSADTTSVADISVSQQLSNSELKLFREDSVGKGVYQCDDL